MKPLPATPYGGRPVARPSTAPRTPAAVENFAEKVETKVRPTPTRAPQLPTPVNRSLDAELEGAAVPSPATIAPSRMSDNLFTPVTSAPVSPTQLEDAMGSGLAD